MNSVIPSRLILKRAPQVLLWRAASSGVGRAVKSNATLPTIQTRSTILNMNKSSVALPSQTFPTRKFSDLGFGWTDDEIKKVIDGDKLVVFMKGTPMHPQCGFSKYVIQIMHMHGVDNFTTLNILEDETLRSRIKEYSNWPTIPQVYMNGEFIGGFDILLQMHQSGDLIEELEKIGHRSALLDEEGDDGDDPKK